MMHPSGAGLSEPDTGFAPPIGIDDRRSPVGACAPAGDRLVV